MTRSEMLYAHGNNCRLLDFDSEKTERVLETCYYPEQEPETVMTSDEWDQFWHGYYNGTDTLQPVLPNLADCV